MVEYAIIDFQNRTLYVAHETRDRRVAEAVVAGKPNGDCDVYYETESNGKLFRVLCTKEIVKTGVPDGKH